MLTLLLAFAAGLVTVLAPCILPILPIVLSGGSAKGRLRPWGIIVGVVISFSVFTLALSWAVQRLGLSPNFSRNLGIFMLAALGALFLVPRMLERLEAWVSSRVGGSVNGERHGFGGGLLIGISLGAVWTPCAGPILASVVAAAQTGTVTGETIGVTIAYAIGAALPMGLIAALGQRITTRVRWLSQRAGTVQKVFGIVLILVASLMFTGLDRRVQSWIITVTPNWLPQLQKFEERTMDSPTPIPTSDTLPNLGQAAELIDITGWINSEPKTLAELRGKVVLVKFWTYTCINCIRTLPYVQAWYDKYQDKGFTILAVHTPEFAFEKIPANVEDAVKDFNITYPVALDPAYATWTAYRNRYWPAAYLVDAQGRLRYTHFGEGDYDITEGAIQTLLAEAGQDVADMQKSLPTAKLAFNQTPETYFGTARAERMGHTPELARGTQTYTPIASLPLHAWAFGGSWIVGEEDTQATKGSTLDFRVRAKEVYLVLGNQRGVATPLNVEVDGKAGTNFAIKSSGENAPTLYRVANFPEASEHHLHLSFPEGGLQLYAATFGSADAPGFACAPDGSCTVRPTE
ncbi:MAG: cytochrome c biogenesis protein DipZ [Patescibacteria group bacterium]